MAFNPTSAQSSAIKADGCVLVSAAAGSGKTAVLVERVIRKLTDKKNPVFADRLLIVTFTNAAAAEMLSRIESRLYEETQKNPDDELLARQRYLIKSADICTIDSFCIKLVRDNFSLLGIEPDFKVTDDSQLLGIRREVLDSLVGGYIQEGKDDFKRLLELSNCRFGEGELINLIDEIYSAAKKSPFMKGFISSLGTPYKAPFDREHIWYKYAFSAAEERIKSLKKKAERLAEEALFSENADKAAEYSQAVASVIYEIELAVNSGEWDSVWGAVRSAALGKVPNKSTDTMKSLKEQIVRDIESIKAFFSCELSAVQDELQSSVGAVSLLSDLVNAYDERLFERLKQENRFSFDDIEQMAFTLLCTEDENGKIIKTEQADEMISRYDEVLVDEFQDVNDLQDALFDVLSDNGKRLFIVGDVKQSIYGFRGSNPDNFLNKKNAYEDYNEAATGKKQKIILSDNFRSRKGICESVNFFFENLMRREVGNLIYSSDEHLNYGASFPENLSTDTDLLVIDKVDDESGDSIMQSEAVAIANYIKNTVENGVLITEKDGTQRRVQYGDFCILLAALKEKSGIIADELSKYMIPVKVNDGDYFASTEVVTALALIHIIDNPQSDVDLLKVLMSPVYNFTAEELAQIKIGRKDLTLFGALSAYADKNEKARRFVEEISNLRRMSTMLPLDKFVSYVFDKTDMINIFSALPGGEARAQNLMTLLTLASDYTGGMSGSIYGFLRYIASLPESAVKPAAVSGDGSVKIMSIHRSKGLQFPICIIAGLSNKINKSDAVAPTVYSKEYGIGFKYYCKSILDKKENLGHRVLNAVSKKEIARERLRLLYVALTRAEEKLCFVCSLNNAQRSLLRAAEASSRGTESISADYIINAANSAEYILAAAIIHPDADILRRTAEVKIKTIETDSHIAVSFIDAAKQASNYETVEDTAVPDTKLKEKIEQNISYDYPYAALAGIPAKISVSELANRAESEHFAMTDRPSFMQKDGLSAAGRGTATHKIMQFIKFDKSPDVEREIGRLLSEKRITENEALAADRGAIKRFFESRIYKRICASTDVRREMRFLTELPVSMYQNENSDSDDKFIVQGAVDLCFLEPDGVVVLDFKTDSVDDTDELKKRYKDQLSVYASACEKIFESPVKEKIIYSFKLSDYISV